MDFLDAAYTIIVEENRVHTKSLVEALEETEMWRSGGPPSEPREPAAPQVSANERQIVRENTKSLMELQKMMGNVSFGGGC